MCGLLMLSLAGCQGPRDQLREFDLLYTGGDWEGAWMFTETLPEPSDPPAKDDLLWALQRAMVERQRQHYEASNEWFNRAEAILKHFDFDRGALDGVGSTLVNENTIPYRGTAYDAIMVNTYKALNYMALGEDEAARVEFNRAMDRQRRAREHFAKEIAEQKEALQEKQTNPSVDYDKTLNSEETQDAIRDKYHSLYEFEAYPDFVNPFATYVAGLFFAMTGDPGKAIDLLKESAGMVSDNQTLMQDFEAVDRWLERGRPMDPMVWVIYENGVGPIKEEFRVELPLYLVSDEVYYAGIALPQLALRPPATQTLSIQAQDDWVDAEIVVDMDRVIQTEFAKVFPGILTRALISAAAKVVVQEALTDKGTMEAHLMGFAAALYSMVTTAADLRIWTSLPKEFQVVRVPMPEDGTVMIRLSGDQPGLVEIPSCQYALIYVKKVSPCSEPVIEVLTRGPANIP